MRVSYFIKILDDEYVRFFKSIGLQKRFVKEKWWVEGKIIYNGRNYCKKVITGNKEDQKIQNRFNLENRKEGIKDK